MLALTAALVAAVSFTSPASLGRTIRPEGFFAQPDLRGGGWVSFRGPTGPKLARIGEDGLVTPVALPPMLRGRDLEVLPLKGGWFVMTNRFWPGGQREESRCTTPPYGVAMQLTNCGVLVAAQYSPAGRWTRVQRLSHSSGSGAEGDDEPAAVISGEQVELAWHADQSRGQEAPIAVTTARPGGPFGAVHIARRVLRFGPRNVELSTFRGQLYLRSVYGFYSDHLVERRLYADGHLGAPHYAKSPWLDNYFEALRAPHNSELLVFQEGEAVGVARRTGWSAKYQGPSIVSRTAETGFEVAASPNDRLLVSTRSSTDHHSAVVASEMSPAGALGSTSVVESDSLNSYGDYVWDGAIDDAGAALLATVDQVADNAIWLHPSALGCSGFSQRIPLTENGRPSEMTYGEGNLIAFAGARSEFHLVWITPQEQVKTTTLHVSCVPRSAG